MGYIRNILRFFQGSYSIYSRMVVEVRRAISRIDVGFYIGPIYTMGPTIVHTLSV